MLDTVLDLIATVNNLICSIWLNLVANILFIDIVLKHSFHKLILDYLRKIFMTLVFVDPLRSDFLICKGLIDRRFIDDMAITILRILTNFILIN
jgi:hypothetical protein